MFCYKCGAQIEDKSVFCHKCGVKFLDGDTDKMKSDLVKEQKQKGDTLPDMMPKGAEMNKANMQSTSKNDGMEIGFKEFVDNHVKKTTEFESAEALLNSKVPQKFLWICFGIPALLLFFIFIREPSFATLLALIMMFGIFVYPIGLLLDFIFSYRITGGDHKVDKSIDADDLILFLNRNLRYLSPYFNEWNYIKMVGVGMKAALVATAQNAVQGTRIGTGFGHKKSCFCEIHITSDHLNPDSGKMVYFFSTAIKSIWPARYVCMTKATPILQAAMEYYLNEYTQKD